MYRETQLNQYLKRKKVEFRLLPKNVTLKVSLYYMFIFLVSDNSLYLILPALSNIQKTSSLEKSEGRSDKIFGSDHLKACPFLNKL